jgi:RNA polymerase sigma factor (sigma-70 family)
MDFTTLFKKISPKLRIIARAHKGRIHFLDEDDLYQEMCYHLWEKFRGGMPEGINESYIIKGCEFYLSNYIRTQRDNATFISLEQPISENGETLMDILPYREEPLSRYLEKKILIDYVRNNGFTQREKNVFFLLAEGYTAREVGQKLGISHVMVLRYKNNLIEKLQRKEKI